MSILLFEANVLIRKILRKNKNIRNGTVKQGNSGHFD